MTHEFEGANQLEYLQRNLAQIGRWMVIVVRFLDAGLALLLAVGTYLTMMNWDSYEFWSRSSAITVFVVAYMILDKVFVHNVPLRTLLLEPLRHALQPTLIALRPELPGPELVDGRGVHDADRTYGSIERKGIT